MEKKRRHKESTQQKTARPHTGTGGTPDAPRRERGKPARKDDHRQTQASGQRGGRPGTGTETTKAGGSGSGRNQATRTRRGGKHHEPGTGATSWRRREPGRPNERRKRRDREPKAAAEKTTAPGAAPRTKRSAPGAHPTTTERPAASDAATTPDTRGRNTGDSRRPPENPTTAGAAAGKRESADTKRQRTAPGRNGRPGRGTRDRDRPTGGGGATEPRRRNRQGHGAPRKRTKPDSQRRTAAPKTGKPAGGGGRGKPDHRDETGKSAGRRAERNAQRRTRPGRERAAGGTNHGGSERNRKRTNRNTPTKATANEGNPHRRRERARPPRERTATRDGRVSRSQGRDEGAGSEATVPLTARRTGGHTMQSAREPGHQPCPQTRGTKQ